MTRTSISFERFKEEIISFEKFLIRLFKFYLIATVLLFVSLIPGVVGLYLIEDLSLSQASINALSILGTIDPPFPPKTELGMGFTALFGVFSDTVFLLSLAILVAPVAHRFFHRFHFED